MIAGMDLASLQVPLLAVSLLVMTLLLIGLGRRELRERDALIRHVSAATGVITRQEYFAMVIDTMHGSISAGVTGTVPPPEEARIVDMVMESVTRATERGAKVRYILPLSPDRLQMGRRYKTAGAEVRFHPDLLVSDARYMVADDRTVVIGVPERKGPGQPTRKGYSILSESIASLFTDRFEQLWESAEAVSYAQYILDLAGRARQTNPNVSCDVIASNLKVEKEDVEYVDAILKDRIAGSRKRG
ncbi:MAG: hypothetical protein JRN39_06355 [Nitrososphaerota archaeon]|nr:hypothetical protein [Nitrososphaerota archaeon]